MFFLRRLAGVAAAAVLPAVLLACSAARTPAADFTLTDDRGGPWRLSEQRGHAVVLTFGFTNCADTCPQTLAKLSHVVKGLRSAGGAVTIVMVSVDPRRDTPSVLHRFVTKFDGPVVGLTGSPGAVHSVESAYHVWAAPLQKHRDGSYDVAHTATISLIDRRGRLAGVVNDNDDEQALRRALQAAST